MSPTLLMVLGLLSTALLGAVVWKARREARSMGMPLRQAMARMRGDFRSDPAAIFSVAPALAMAAIIIGAFLVITVASLFIGQYFTATATVVDAFENTTITTGNDDADNIKENVFPIILGLTALFGLGSLVIGALSFSNRD